MLDRISHNGVFSIVALDHRSSLKNIVNPRNPNSVTKNTMSTLKLKFSKVFAGKASGILLDPEYGMPAIKALGTSKCGLIISLEKSGYEKIDGERLTSLLRKFNPSKAKEIGADAVKIVVYYNVHAKSAKQQENLVENLSNRCKDIGIPLICEVLVYNLGEKDYAEKKIGMILESAAKFSSLGIDLLKAEFPGNVKTEERIELERNCRNITKSSKVKWVLLSRGVSYHEFREQLKIAISGGASGFMVGRALWQEYFNYQKKEQAEFLNKECIRRLEELKAIASKRK